MSLVVRKEMMRENLSCELTQSSLQGMVWLPVGMGRMFLWRCFHWLQWSLKKGLIRLGYQ